MNIVLSKIIRYCIIFSLLSFIILLFTLDLVIETNGQFVLSGYGILILIYFVTMMILSNKNKTKIKNILTGNIKKEYLDNTKKSTACIICGYKENPQYFVECLESIFVNSSDIDKIILVIDGNDESDDYMIDIFNLIFTENNKYYYLNNTLDESLDETYNSPEQIKKCKDKFKTDAKFICVSQKHKGKRHAMFTGFQIALINNLDLSITVDSDTIFEDNAINLLKATFNDSRIGGATGNLKIFNNTNIISFLSYLRYWSAFNLERAYGSYYGGVLCLSGPISCYRNSILASDNLLNLWLNQMFLGKQCTFGDDRHLTNRILETGYQTAYNPYSIAYTETPETISRFIKQQTRWTKSGYRESLWVLGFLHKHNILMTIDVVYQLFYPLIIFSLIIYTMWKFSVLSIIIYLGLIFTVGFIRSIYAVLVTNNLNYLLFYNYSLLYLTIIIPIKFYALLSLTDTTWGNLGRYKLTNNLVWEWIIIGLWNILLLSGFIVTFNLDKINYDEYIIFSSLLSVYVFGIATVFGLSKYSNNKILESIKIKQFKLEDNRSRIKKIRTDNKEYDSIDDVIVFFQN